MKKSRLIHGMLALLLVGSTFPFMGNTMASAEENNFAQQEAIIENSISPRASINTSLNINKPYYSYDNTYYLFAVIYEWDAGSGGDRIAGSLYEEANYRVFNDSNRWMEIVFPEVANTTLCETSRTYYRTYNSSTDEYSYNYVSMEYLNGNTYEYGRHCRWKPKAMFTNKANTTYFQEVYDVTNYNLWTHNGGVGEIIIATIRYQNVCYNIKLSISWIGYATKEVTINNVTFSLRTGPFKCSLKCNSSTVYNTDVDFAFDVVANNNAILNQVNFV